MKISLIRHAQTTANAKNILQGHLDTELSELGIEQSRNLASKLPLNFDAVFSSSLKRALQTIEIALNELGTEMEIIPREGLREIDVGVFEGLSVDNLSDEMRDLWSRFRTEANLKDHKGETWNDFLARTKESFEEVVSISVENRWHHVLIVTHGGVFRAILTNLLGVAEPPFKNADVITIENQNGTWNRSHP